MHFQHFEDLEFQLMEQESLKEANKEEIATEIRFTFTNNDILILDFL